MRLTIHAAGRLKAGPEQELCERYLDRLRKAGPAVGIEFSGVSEVAESRLPNPEGRKREEARLLEAALPAKAVLVLLDERGKPLSTRQFADKLSHYRGQGARDMVIAIGGPDGLDPELAAKAALVVAFGAMTWPHQLIRVLLAEQLYRVVTLLSGHPYHRD